jgi:hypothetical protein
MGRIKAVARGSITVGKKALRQGSATAERPSAGRTRGTKPVRRAKAEPGGRAGEAAHQLRNRLGAIVNAVYYLKLISPPDERIHEYLGILEREVRALRLAFDPAGGSPGEPSAPTGSDATS